MAFRCWFNRGTAQDGGPEIRVAPVCNDDEASEKRLLPLLALEQGANTYNPARRRIVLDEVCDSRLNEIYAWRTTRRAPK